MACELTDEYIKEQGYIRKVCQRNIENVRFGYASKSIGINTP
jgi:hypothetical protein